MTVKTNSVVPQLPSFLDTSSMVMRGSSSAMVPTPCPSPMTPPWAWLRLTEGLVRFADAIAVDQDRDRLTRIAGLEGQRSRGRLVIGARGRAVGGAERDRDRPAGCGGKCHREVDRAGARMSFGDRSRRRC